jgi:hypothetical protein
LLRPTRLKLVRCETAFQSISKTSRLLASPTYYTDWSILYTDARDFAGEPLVDQSRLLNDGFLSVFIQENDDAVTTITGTPLHVLEFNVVAELAGDFNGDGTVDAADYVIWRKNDGSLEGYNTWRAHFGTLSGVGGGAANAARVTEPSGIWIAFLLASGLWLSAGRRRML